MAKQTFGSNQRQVRQTNLTNLWASVGGDDSGQAKHTNKTTQHGKNGTKQSGMKRSRDLSSNSASLVSAKAKISPSLGTLNKARSIDLKWENLSQPNGPLLLLHGHIGGKTASERKLTRQNISLLPEWNDNVVFKIYGKECRMRRRICQYSTEGELKYSYSGLKNMIAPDFPEVIYSVKCQVENALCDYILKFKERVDTTKDYQENHLTISPEFIKLIEEVENNSEEGNKKEIFNYCLLNHYRSGEEYMGWHSDDEKMLDLHSPIASVSFGVTRNFDIRARKKMGGEKRTRLARIPLGDGDLLLMFPPMQDHYEHGVPVEKRVAGDRINLTFRRVSE